MGASATAQADAAISELRRAYHDGLTRVGFSVQDAAAMLVAGPLVALTGSYNSAQQAIAKNMQDLAPRIDRWAQVWRGWAERGSRDDGSAYGWDRWFPAGRELADAVRYHTGEASNASLFNVVTSTIVASANEAKLAVSRAGAVVEGIGANLHVIAAGAGALGLAYVAFTILPRRRT